SMKSALVEELNRIIRGQRLDQLEEFRNNPFLRRQSTLGMTNVPDTAALNRMILMDAFPMEFSALTNYIRVEPAHYVRTLRHSELGLELSESGPRVALAPMGIVQVPSPTNNASVMAGSAHFSRGVAQGGALKIDAPNLALGLERTDFIVTVLPAG